MLSLLPNKKNSRTPSSGIGWIAISFLWLCVSFPVNAEEYRVYLIAGQSNANGRGDASQLADPLSLPQRDVRFYWHRTQKVDNAKWVPEDQWTDLAPGTGHGTSKPVHPKEFGLEISLGAELVKAYPKSKIAIIKYSHGGSNLHKQWADTGPMYVSFATTVKAALDALTAEGHTYKVGGVIWQQGEADTGTFENANAYEDNLKRLIGRIRAEPLIGSDTPFVIGGLSDSQNMDAKNPRTPFGVVRKAQESVAKSVARVGFANTDGFPTRAGDTIHFDHQGQIQLGRAHAAELIRLETQNVNRPVTSAEDTSQTDQPASKGVEVKREAESRKPNILFIAVDDLRPNLGCYGDSLAITPHIDKLAGRGVQFNRAYCQVAVCNPSRASLMTGLRPDTLGVWTLPIHFREAKPDAVTLPQWLRKSGYTAVSHGKIYHNPTPDPQSWSEPIRELRKLPYFYPEGTRELVRDEMAKLPKNDWRKNNLRGPATSSPDLPDNQLLDGAQTDMCIDDLKRLSKTNQPFFLAMGFIRPHLSFVAPKKYWELYNPDSLPVMTGAQMPEAAPAWGLHNNSEISHYVDMIDMPKPWDDKEVDEAVARRLVHGYYACVSYVDAQIGRLLEALDEEGLTDNTIVILWSDHGWKLGDYRGWGKMTNYEIDARVPFIVSAPGMKSTAGKSTQSLVELLDIYPTLCDLAGIESPDFVEGKSLTPILRDVDAKVHEAAVSQYYRSHEGKEYMGYSLRTDDYRYIEWRDFTTGEVRTRELYDHRGAADSHLGKRETKNIGESAKSELLNELSELLKLTHPPKELSMTPVVHTSTKGKNPQVAKLSFRNDYDSEVTVYQIQPSGARSKGRKIEPGKNDTVEARLGEVYVVESKDGTIHEIHSPSLPTNEIVIDR